MILEANLQSLREAMGHSPLLAYRTREAAEETAVQGGADLTIDFPAGAVTQAQKYSCLQLPDVAHLADHVHLMDGLGRPADHADPILKVGLLGGLALGD